MVNAERAARTTTVFLLSWAFLSSSSVLIGSSGAAEAQEGDGAVADGAIALDPVIVTGLKRLDRADELSTSVQVIDGDALATSAIDPGAAITRAAPNFYFSSFSQPGTDFLNMRGVGPLGQPANALDNSVGVSTNGVGTSGFGFPPSLLDVERIEVLRGPQGTLFGRNALGGAVNVVTRPADGVFEASLTGEFGSSGYALAEAKTGGWIVEDSLAGRFAVRYQRQDGDIPNVVVGGEEGDVEIAAARATLRYLPTDDLSVNLIVGADRDERRQNFSMLREQDEVRSGADLIPLNSRERIEGTLEIEQRFDAMTFTSVTAFQNNRIDVETDITDDLLFQASFGFVTPPGADRLNSDDKEWIINQEFRLNSPEDAEISWVAGVNYFRSLYDSLRIQDSAFSPFSSGNFDTEIDSQTIAVFGDVTYPVFEDFRLAGGLRLARDDQNLKVHYTTRGFPGTVASFTQDTDISDTYLTGRVAAFYDLTDSIGTYASVSRGYASGGYERNTLNAVFGEDTVPFKPSKIWAYEAGIKSQFLQDRAEVNFSAFFNDVSDGQLLASDPTTIPSTFSFVNQDYQSYGFELEGRAALTDDLFVSGGVGVSIAEIKNVPDNAIPGMEDGNTVPNAPKLTAFVDARYQLTENFYLTGQYQYVGKRELNIQNADQLDDYHMVNARFGFEEDQFSIYAFVNNMLDERPEYYSANITPVVNTVTVGPGRIFGVGVSVHF